MTLDLRCYLVTSGTDRHTVETAALAAGAGAGIVQVRAKTLATRDLLSLVLQVGEAVRRANPETRVVVDDRADVAWAAMRARGNVHGVHLGVEDFRCVMRGPCSAPTPSWVTPPEPWTW